jgi:hypothetical protein
MKLIVGAAALALVLAGCASADAEEMPKADEFRAGTCRQAAEPVLALARIAERNDGADGVSMSDRQELATHQKTLKAIKPEAELATPLTELITAIGFVRIRLDGKSYDPALLRDLDAARRAVQSRCTS